MNVEIIDTPLNLTVYGFSGTAVNKDYAGTAFALMNKMWPIVKSANLKNKGQNIWVYEQGEQVFAGVELYNDPESNAGLERKIVTLPRYAYYKHIGPYHLLKQRGEALHGELKSKGLTGGYPYIEIYGHWTNDESKLETELLICLH